MTKNINERAADNIRILSMAMVEKANSGHPGGAMGGADFIHILFSEFLSFDPSNPRWINRDRFFLDPGHMSPMLYSVLMLTGFFSVDDIMQFRQWGSITPGHPELDLDHGVENTSGPLGQGHTMAVGAAIAGRFLAERFGRLFEHKIYTYISDGGVQEEISQGAGRLAGHLGLYNLVMFYDSNDIQLSTETSAVTDEQTADKYRAWGWRVMEIDGHSHDQIRGALRMAADENEKPVLIIGKTVMGKGLVDESGNSFEGRTSTHGLPVTHAGASFKKSVANLGGDPENPFGVFSDVSDLYKNVLANRAEDVAQWKEKKAEWDSADPVAARQLDDFYSGVIPEIDFNSIPQKENDATRNASATLLSVFAEKIPNMIVASADLANSDKTDGFLKQSKPLVKGDFSGAFLHVGVSELTMGALLNGMALHGGVIPAGGTFFVFSDYMKPAVRLAALMGLPVKYIWTHDAFRVGEDGPTHQPVEQEAQIRLMEHLKNHHGENSMLVLRPADAPETNIAWKLALENTRTPTALILSRQNIKTLPSGGIPRIEAAAMASRGAYVVTGAGGNPDVIMVASGSEVATLVEAAALLAGDGIKTRIVSAPSEGLFRMQDKEYRDSVMAPGIPVFCLTAGLPVTMLGFAGSEGKVFGLESFGYSASYKILDEKFGFTGENIAKEVKEFLRQ
jgi:transketolase